jgi:wyosine [tRNA(Phe)-imidazoG37] synthetase (radical SAM superfamily)
MTALTTTDHRRDRAGLVYIYPVLSRRSGGLSIGVNLNPNNACNWRCVYCQVPDLRRGGAPAIDLAMLTRELESVLDEALHGDFFDRYDVPPDQRVIRDIAISGNGEPTSAIAFERVVELIGETGARLGLSGQIKHVLISNGSLMRRAYVQRGLARWNELGGEVWFKVDRVTSEGIARVNGVHLDPKAMLANLQAAATRCPTWLQTCMFAIDGQPPDASERQAYLDWVDQAVNLGIPPRGILLYGLARPSMQPEASRLSPVSAEWLESIARDLRQTGLTVRVTP